MITDSHGGKLMECLMLKEKYKHLVGYISDYSIDEKEWLYYSKSANIELDILILSGHTGYNFVDHLQKLAKDYSDSKIILYVGYNDLRMLQHGKNIQDTAYKYIKSLSEKFIDNQKVVISPLKNINLIKDNSQAIELYRLYTEYLKGFCNDMSIDYVDVYSLIKNVLEDDYEDEDHLRYDLYSPIIDYVLEL